MIRNFELNRTEINNYCFLAAIFIVLVSMTSSCNNPKEENPFLGYWVSDFYTEYDNDTINFYFHEDYLKIKDQFYQYKFDSTEITISTFDDCLTMSYNYELNDNCFSIDLIDYRHLGCNLLIHSLPFDAKEDTLTFTKRNFTEKHVVPDYATMFIEDKPCKDSMFFYGTWVDTSNNSIFIIDTNMVYNYFDLFKGYREKKGNIVRKWGNYSERNSLRGRLTFFYLSNDEIKFIGCDKIGIYGFGEQRASVGDIEFIKDGVMNATFNYSKEIHGFNGTYTFQWIKVLDYPLKGDDRDEIIIPSIND